MKINLFFLAFTIFCSFTSEISFARSTSQCPGEEGYTYVNARRRNPTNGGFVSNQAFVDDTDDIFIAPSAAICGSSKITEYAKIYGNSVIDNSSVYGHAEISGNARVSDGAEIFENAKVNENAKIIGSVRILGKAVIAGEALIYNNSQDDLVQVLGQARVTGKARVTNNAEISGNARIMGNAIVFGNTQVNGTAVITGYTKLASGLFTSGTRNDPDYEGIARANKEAQEAEIARQAKLEKEKREKEILDKKMKRYNQLINTMTAEGLLGTFDSQRRSIVISSFCQMDAQYRIMGQGDFNYEDRSYSIKLNMKKHGKFSVEPKVFGSSTTCINLDLRDVDYGVGTEAHYVDNLTNKEWQGLHMSCMNLIFEYSNQKKAEEGVSMLNELSNICKSL